ncbi:hypothetical protein NQ318_021185 [Aromia moschata]|uniref:Peptidase S9A N-terminal domain-containing protein n=1 Tax=Aromia moschata TaxID=1265417 RepID=A0AAV8YHP4_9CUCU|nr:hypothetical protein NQ318_021185 [Aromia moschata]
MIILESRLRGPISLIQKKQKLSGDAQNAVTRPFINQCEYKTNIKDKITNCGTIPNTLYLSVMGTNTFNIEIPTLKLLLFLDPNALSEDGTVALAGTAFSEDGQDYDEVLKKSYLSQTGKADGSETKSSENQKLYYHKLGTQQSEDIICRGASVSDCGNYLIVTPIKGCKNNLLYFTETST